MDAVLRALQAADFDWTTHLDSIWKDSPYDVPEIQGKVRGQVLQEVEALQRSAKQSSPLGVAIVGQAGSGKTHLLSALRAGVIDRGLLFVLVDMTDVTDFWETVLLGYIRSLQQPAADGASQLRLLLADIVRASGAAAGTLTPERLQKSRPPGLINHCDTLIRGLAARHPDKIREHKDVLRALVLFANDDFELQDIGYKWLLGIGIDDEDGFRRGFSAVRRAPSANVQGLSWLTSLAAPTVLALDQLDAIVAEHNLLSSADPEQERSARQQASLGIIQGIAKGLMALRDVTQRTLTVVSCLEATWRVLEERVPVSMADRFQAPAFLQALGAGSALEELVALRLRAALPGDYAPPYPTYPFPRSFFERHRGASPREVLRHCDEHRRHCLRDGVVVEPDGALRSKPPVAPDLGREIAALAEKQEVERWLEEQDERSLDRLVETACLSLREENPVGSDIDVAVDHEFVGTNGCDPLHARIRLVFRAEGDRERHYAFRFVQMANARAFQTRVKAAMTAAGIERALPFRRLALLRCGPVPSGAVTAKLTQEFADRGGVLLSPTLDELRTLAAIYELLASDQAQRVRDYLRAERPVSKLATFADAAAWLFADRAFGRHSSAPSPAVPEPRASKQAAAPRAGSLPVGRKLVAGTPKDEIELPLDNLTKHVVVLAGAGSGKTVLLRRLVEEAALLDVPSIVVDGANDLSRLGDPWPDRPEAFADDDLEKARRYHAKAEVVIWTPGRENGNPLNLELVPDFSAVRDDADELQAAIDMTRSSLEPIVAPGKSAKDQIARGILASALRYFASQGGGTLRMLIELLMDLPADASAGFEKAQKQAREAAERLLAAVETNPLLRGRGADLDPGRLLSAERPDKVRVSVINLSGLADRETQQQFVNQLSMALFSWIKKHPARGRSLQGLLVIDEARDFVPSGRSVPGKENLIRLVAQARKYGLGMVFATQAPKSIDHNVIANASTQFYGRANSPAAIEVVQEQLRERGGSGSDVAKLPRGTFYVFSEGLGSPVKVSTSLCLSHHPASPPDESEILERAARSRKLVS